MTTNHKMLDNLRTALSLIDRPRRGRWTALVLLAVISAGMELVAALLVFVLLGAVTGSSISVPVIDALISTGENVSIMGLAAATAGFYLLRTGVRMFQIYAESRVIQSEGVVLSRRLMTGYLLMPYELHLGRNSSDLIKTAFWTVDEMLARYLTPMVKIASEVLVSGAIVTVLLVVSPGLTLVAAGVLGMGALALLRLTQPILKRIGEEGEQFTRSSLLTLQESLRGIRDVKLTNTAGYFVSRFASARTGLGRTRYLSTTLTETPRYVLESFVVLGIVGIVLVANRNDAIGESLAILGLFGYAAFRLLPSVNRIVAALNRMKYGDTPLRVVATDLAMVDEFLQSEDKIDVSNDRKSFDESIRFDSVTYRYPGATTEAIRNISFEVSPGESVGIVGETGSGKTTLLDLLVGLLKPESGRVLVDGTDIRELGAMWLSQLGVVSQTVFLLDDTVMANIAVGVSEADISTARVSEVVRIAQLTEFVDSLPSGLDTRVGESGIKLSGGQRQRIAIARALYADPPVLVLDEGTAALDGVTEAELISAINSLRDSHTMFLVAHRLTTVKHCDRILFVENGEITDSGTYEELKARNSTFARMAG